VNSEKWAALMAEREAQMAERERRMEEREKRMESAESAERVAAAGGAGDTGGAAATGDVSGPGADEGMAYADGADGVDADDTTMADADDTTVADTDDTAAAGADNGAGAGALKDWKIDGLDMDKCLERFADDEETVLLVLRSYATNTRPLLEQARAVTQDGLPAYAIVVHGIKGSSRGICAEQVGAAAEALEHAAKAGNFEFVKRNNAAFIETAERLIGDLDIQLKAADDANQKPERETPDKLVLDRLKDACGDYDMDGVDTAMSELECFSYTAADARELIEWLRTAVARMDFGEIAERLSPGPAEQVSA
jgi:hypothetical protein